MPVTPRIGSPINITTTVTVSGGGAVSGVTVTVIDPSGNLRVNEAAMSAIEGATATFRYTMQTQESWPPGNYIAICRASSGGYTDPETATIYLAPLH